jgi:acyl-CoA synthetase (AMP-forming)/AMP-acid ligase II
MYYHQHHSCETVIGYWLLIVNVMVYIDGAALIYTGGATTAKPAGIELLQEYIYHRLYSFRLYTPAKVVTGNSDDFSIYVPTGYDSTQIMSSTGIPYSCAPACCPDINAPACHCQ